MGERQYRIEKKLTEEDVAKMSDDEKGLYYDWARRDYDTYNANRENYSHTIYFGKLFMPPGGRREVIRRKKEYDETHKSIKELSRHNYNLMKKNVLPRLLTFEDIQGDPLDYYPSLIQKKHLIFIAQELNLKSSGTVPELIRILKDDIGKKERKEVIGKILAKMGKKDEKKQNK